MIYTNEKMTNEYGDYEVNDVTVTVNFSGRARDLDLYVLPKSKTEKVFVVLKTTFEYDEETVFGESNINIMGGNVTLIMDYQFSDNDTKQHDIVQITTRNDAKTKILTVPKETRVSVFDKSTTLVSNTNIYRVFVADSGVFSTQAPLNIVAVQNSKVIDLPHDGISNVNASDKAKVTSHNKQINISIDDDATLTFYRAGKPSKIFSKQPMNMHDFACYVAKKEGGKSQANIGDIKQILKIVDKSTGDKLSKMVAEGIYVYEYE